MRAAALTVLLSVAALPLAAQQSPEAKLRAQRAELERIRNERDQLQEQMTQLRSSAHDLADEVTNLDRQADATAQLVQSLDQQLASITDEVNQATANLVRAQDELVIKRAVLQHRLAEIYKRGPLYSVEALLSADSFGELVARYKYLHLLALRDRALVQRVEELEQQIGKQRALLVQLQSEVADNRADKASEEQRLRTLEQQRQSSLSQTRRRVAQTEQRLLQISRDETELTKLIATLEAERVREETRRPSAARSASTLTTSALGALDWPVDGTIIYKFGRVVNPNNTLTRWNGIGIAAPEGTPVRVVASGQVVVAEPFGTYGLTVIVQHGGGDYSVYGSLSRLAVKKGDVVSKGDTIGYVGTSDPEMQPHLHFEIRPQGRAVDPLTWLKEESP